MTLLTRDAILAAVDLRRETVDVPEWGGSVIVSEMTGEARDAWEQSLIAPGSKPNLINVRARLVAACVVNEDGSRMFTPADVETLGRKSGRALDRVAKVAQRLNGLTDDDVEAARGN